MNKKSNGKKKKKKISEKKEQNSEFSPSIDLDVKVPQIKEPGYECKICGKRIQFITQAIMEQDGGYSHIECVLKKIADEEGVKPPKTVSYIGRGAFAIVSKNEEGNFIFERKIQYENLESFQKIKEDIKDLRK